MIIFNQNLLYIKLYRKERYQYLENIPLILLQKCVAIIFQKYNFLKLKISGVQIPQILK